MAIDSAQNHAGAPCGIPVTPDEPALDCRSCANRIASSWLDDSRQLDADPVPLGARFLATPYTDMHEVAGDGDLFVKVASRSRPKRYLRYVSVSYATTVYTTGKFGIRDIVKYEHRMFDLLPEELAPFLPQQRRLVRTVSGRTGLCAWRPFDANGQLSRTVLESGPIVNGPFWDDVDHIIEILRRCGSCLFNVFSAETRALFVQKHSNSHWRPVIMDALKFGNRLNWYRPWMLLPILARGKFERDLAAFRSMYDARSS